MQKLETKQRIIIAETIKTYYTTDCTIKTRDKKNTINQPNISFIFYMDIVIEITQCM